MKVLPANVNINKKDKNLVNFEKPNLEVLYSIKYIFKYMSTKLVVDKI